MENLFKFKIDAVEDSIVSAKSAKSYGESGFSIFNSISSKFKNLGLNFSISGNPNLKEIFDYISELASKIEKIRDEAFAAMTSLDDVGETLEAWIREGKISPQAAAELANSYVMNLAKDNPDYCQDLINSPSLKTFLDLEGFSKELIKPGQYFAKINGQEGYLYIPETFATNDDISFITWFSGIQEVPTYKNKDNGLPYILDNGYQTDALVWSPVYYTSYNNATQFETINSIADTYNLNTEKISLFGYSNGAQWSYKLAEENPGFFSTVVTYGTSYESGDFECPGTTFIMFQGELDSFNTAKNTYDNLTKNGNQAILYKIGGAGHSNVNAMFSDEMVNDAISIKRGEAIDNMNGDIITINGGYAGNGFEIFDNDYYVKLSKKGVSEEQIENINRNFKEKLDKLINNKDSTQETAKEVLINTDSNNNNNEEIQIPTIEEAIDKLNDKNSNIVQNGKSNEPNVGTPKGNVNMSSENLSNGNVGKGTPNYNFNGSSYENDNTTTYYSKTNIEPISKNILPKNEFSSILPQLDEGDLNYTEISNSMVNYDINNISKDGYTNFVRQLGDLGFRFSNGKWLKDNYEVFVKYENNNLDIQLQKK